MELRWIEKANLEQANLHEILSFEEYMNLFEENPIKECRPNCLYLRDMFDHYGKDERGAFKLFQKNYSDSPPVNGQIKTQQEIYWNLQNFTEEGFNNKFILLIGPNGSAKSSLIKKIMKAAETYSEEDAGALYTFSWIFPIDSYVKGSLGLASSTQTDRNLMSYAHLEDKDISAILTSELKDHPLLLVPMEYRQELIQEHLSNNEDYSDIVKKSYLYHGDISKRNRLIYDALLKSYKGDHTEVLKHIRVERFYINRRYSTGAVTVEPQMHVDASMQQITMDKRLASLPPSLQSLNLFNMTGEAISANRGIMEFSDLLKRPLDAFKYLLMTMETQSINLRGILTNLDIFFIGSSNEVHLVAFKQHPDFNSFKGRINFIRVPYLLNAKDEAGIYREQIGNIRDKAMFEPLALEALCLFSVMTRIRPSQEKNFENKSLGKLASSLSPLEKALLFSEGKVPERMTSEERQILTSGVDEILEEYDHESLYEGKFGISPRVNKQVIYEIGANNDNVTFVEVIEYLSKFIDRKNEFDFLNIPPQGEYNNPIRFTESLKSWALDAFDEQVRNCLGLVDDRSYEDYMERYIQNVNALIKGEKIKNPVTGKFEDSDDYFIKEFEKNINLKESADTYRSHVISTLGAHYLDNPGAKIVYSEVFPELIKKLKASFREEQKKLIVKVAQNFMFFVQERNGEGDKKAAMTEDNRQLINDILGHLRENYGYSEQGALNQLQYLIKEKY
jgi:predicted Ser/Thr protein kinase